MKLLVNGKEIPESAIRFELNRLVKFYAEHMAPEEVREQMSLLHRKAVDQAIGARLLMDEVEARKIVPSERAVVLKMRSLMAQAGGEDPFVKALAGQGLSIEAVREGVVRGLAVDMLVGELTESVDEPGEEEILSHFRAHAEEYRLSDRAQAQHILIKPVGDSAEARTEARDRLVGIRQRIEEGADFGEMASAYSDCPSGQSGAGSLGWFSRGMMVPEFDQAVFAMSVGELSEVIETPFGFHIIYKTDAEAGGPAEYDEVRDKVRDFLRHARRGEVIARHIAELKKAAAVSIEE